MDDDTAEDARDELAAVSERRRAEALESVFRSVVHGAGAPGAPVLPEEVIVAAPVGAADNPADAGVVRNSEERLNLVTL